MPVQLPDILNFFGWLIDTHFKEKNAAISTIRLYKSALLWYYKEQKLIVDPLVNQGIETLLKGYQRRVADRKSRGEMPTFEGKHHLTYDGYCLLATALFKMDPFNQMLFGWPFLVLQWNLIARSATVDAMMMEHISWEADSLLISTPKSKSDQEERNASPATYTPTLSIPSYVQSLPSPSSFSHESPSTIPTILPPALRCPTSASLTAQTISHASLMCLVVSSLLYRTLS